MARPKHPNKDIEKALQYAESNGWRVEKSGGSAHAFGQLYCPTNNGCRGNKFCRKSIWSTPSVPEKHAKEIRRIVDGCSEG